MKQNICNTQRGCLTSKSKFLCLYSLKNFLLQLLLAIDISIILAYCWKSRARNAKCSHRWSGFWRKSVLIHVYKSYMGTVKDDTAKSQRHITEMFDYCSYIYEV